MYAEGGSPRHNSLAIAKAGLSRQATEVPVAKDAKERVGFNECLAAKNPLKLMLAGGISGAIIGGTLGGIFGFGGGALPGAGIGFVGGAVGVVTGDTVISAYACIDPNSRPLK